MAVLTQAQFAYISALWHNPREEIVVRDGEIRIGLSSLVYDEALVQAAMKRADAEREAKVEFLRRETAVRQNPPLWVTLPAQAMACIAWLMFVTLLGSAYALLGIPYVIAESIRAIVRGLRWALC